MFCGDDEDNFLWNMTWKYYFKIKGMWLLWDKANAILWIREFSYERINASCESFIRHTTWHTTKIKIHVHLRNLVMQINNFDISASPQTPSPNFAEQDFFYRTMICRITVKLAKWRMTWGTSNKKEISRMHNFHLLHIFPD